jgi:Flp pilus assembly protein TadB
VHDRIVPSLVFAGLAAAVLAFVLIGRPIAAIMVFAVVGFGWGTFVRPARRRRQYKAIADRPRWKISAD